MRQGLSLKLQLKGTEDQTIASAFIHPNVHRSWVLLSGVIVKNTDSKN
jgi:hypothetical protein